MRREQLPGYPLATYVMPGWQALYVSVNKAACTSLKWLVADLQDERPERFHRALWGEVTRPMTIHLRRLWQHTPTAASLSDEALAEIAPDRDWFVFAVVRHPVARLFSAWQSKLLLREPAWVADYGEADWFPRIPRSGDEVVEDFERFAVALADGRAPLMRNRHFAPQRRLLAPKRMDYTRIYRTSELAQLLEDFERHLRARGYDGEPLTLRRANETPLPPIPSLFGPAVQEAGRKLYKSDFETFGYADAVPGGLDASDRYGDEAVAEVGRLIERSERIGDLAGRARELRRQLAALRAAPPAPEPSAARRWAWRAKRRLVRR